MKYPVLDKGRYAVCYDTLELRYFDDWVKAEDYLYEVYVSKDHSGFWIKDFENEN